MKQFLKSLPVGIPSAIIIILVTYLSLSSDPFHTKDIPLFPGADKLAHVIMYMAVAGVFILDYAKHILPHHAKINVELALAVSASLLGLLLEIAQLVMRNGRGYEFWDWIADTVGALAALLIVRWWFMPLFRNYFLGRHRHSHKHHHHHHKEEASTN